MKQFKTKYGFFDTTKNEYVITNVLTPRPWVNVLSNGRWGCVLSQAGGGYSWLTHANLNRITRWEQDLIRDSSGKFVYIKDKNNNKCGTLTLRPGALPGSHIQCRHGLGYTVFETKWDDLLFETTVFVHPEENAEIWRISVKNNRSTTARLSIYYYLEWLLGRWPDAHREFHRTFIQTGFTQNALIARKRLWEIPNNNGENWNRSWEGEAFLSSDHKIHSYDSDKEKFIGNYRDFNNPEGLNLKTLSRTTGNWQDSVGVIRLDMNIPPEKTKNTQIFLGHGKNTKDVQRIINKLKKDRLTIEKISGIHSRCLNSWDAETPDSSFNLLNNIWVRHQAITCRIKARAGYYQSSGAYGYRDQLQDSLVFLQTEPDKTLKQIQLHSRHQYKSGRVHHWWHPITGEGAKTGMSDDLLWLPYVLSAYLKETNNFESLSIKEPYLEGTPATLYEHACAAIDAVLARRSPRGIPLMGEGDWNDGMNSVGDKEKGESFWLGIFLTGILKDYIYIAQQINDTKRSKLYKKSRKILKDKINRYGWDGQWYRRATTDSGRILGTRKEKYGKIFLNPQTWALINDLPSDSRKKSVITSMKKYLFREYGPILFWPAYGEPDEEIGYLTRYAPGVRENGGLYTHAGTWGVLALAHINMIDDAYKLFQSFNPVLRGMNPDKYKAEPYVTPGNVDGPDSPNFGTGGWTWYTGSAGWLFRVSEQGILGIVPHFDGLMIRGTLPAKWKTASVKRVFRGKVYNIHFKNNSSKTPAICVEGKKINGNIVLYTGPKKEVNVTIE